MRMIIYNGKDYTSAMAYKFVAEKVLKDACVDYGFRYHEIVGESRQPDIVKKRREIGHLLFSLGFSVNEVAYALKRDRSTVQYYRGKDESTTNQEE